MPCTDVADKLTMLLNPDDTIRAYSFEKRTCAGAVGHKSLLMAYVGGKTLDEVCTWNWAYWLSLAQPADVIEEFILAKHVAALHELYNELVGSGETFATGEYTSVIDEYIVEAAFIKIVAFIPVAIDVAKVKSCGDVDDAGCGDKCGCVAKKKALAKKAALASV